MIRRLLRSVFSFAAAASLALCAVTVALWARSYGPNRGAAAYASGARRYEFAAADGRLTVTRIDGLRDPWDGVAGRGRFVQPARTRKWGVEVDRGEYVPNPRAFPAELLVGGTLPPGAPAQAESATPLGLLFVPTPTPVAVRASLPLRLPATAAALLSAAWVVTRVRRLWLARRRVSSGLCPSCGYDLRATAGRCPECGTEPEVKQRPTV
jgi:hypothetical protein